MTTFDAKYFRSRDGLRLHYRDYAGDPAKAPVLFLPGLTRHSGDFERNAVRIAPDRRVISIDMRGRGQSQYDANWLNYHPGIYVDDTLVLLNELGVRRVIAVGTSLGGVMAMTLACMRPELLAGVVLNDIGPEVNWEGTRRLQGYVSRTPALRDWDAASAYLKETFENVYPDFTPERWAAFARDTFQQHADGSLHYAYDPKIAELMRLLPLGAMPPMWYAYAFLRAIPTLAIRGELSDLLTPQVFSRMKRDKPDLQQITVPNRGHVPLLHEPICQDALEAFLKGIGE